MTDEPSRGRPSAACGRNPRIKVRVRTIIAIMLIALWGLSILTGFLQSSF